MSRDSGQRLRGLGYEKDSGLSRVLFRVERAGGGWEMRGAPRGGGFGRGDWVSDNGGGVGT